MWPSSASITCPVSKSSQVSFHSWPGPASHPTLLSGAVPVLLQQEWLLRGGGWGRHLRHDYNGVEELPPPSWFLSSWKSLLRQAPPICRPFRLMRVGNRDAHRSDTCSVGLGHITSLLVWEMPLPVDLHLSGRGAPINDRGTVDGAGTFPKTALHQSLSCLSWWMECSAGDQQSRTSRRVAGKPHWTEGRKAVGWWPIG